MFAFVARSREAVNSKPGDLRGPVDEMRQLHWGNLRNDTGEAVY